MAVNLNKKAYSTESAKSLPTSAPRPISNKVLSPSYWCMKNPSNRIAGNEDSDAHFQNYLRDRCK
jgi:hypothetical protein